MAKEEFTRLGIALNTRQVTRLRDIHARFGIPQSRLVGACADVLTDEEVVDIMKRYADMKAEEARTRFATLLKGDDSDE